ncbi:hypothetical protein UFOVP194_37 [uncultured Caudovirales phage]|jgi:hypothetical protein|uniref:Uncharacterized protein n=1 Tax=uncultured Caudovirales phage TaxID=2100421 RepID=A0A6J7WIK8_9CAUD|nr:hypothetical protein UFOVP194_37 [uncultured Caudovirales phage]
MDWQAIINFSICGIFTVIGWFLKQLWDSIQSLKNDIKSIEVSLPTHYVRQSDLNTRFDKLEAILDRIFDKLDSKADKD